MRKKERFIDWLDEAGVYDRTVQSMGSLKLRSDFLRQIDKAANYDELDLDAGQSFTLEEGAGAEANDDIIWWCGGYDDFDTTGDLGSPGTLVGCP